MKDLLDKYLKKIYDNIFYRANKFRNNIITKPEGQRLFFIKTCEGLENLVQALGYNYWLLNKFQEKETREYFEKADVTKMSNKEYNAFLKFKNTFFDFEKYNTLIADEIRNSLEHFLGNYTMLCMSEEKAKQFEASAPNLETFLENLGIVGTALEPKEVPNKPIKYIVDLMAHIFKDSPDFIVEDWEGDIGKRLFDLINEYRQMEIKEIEKKQLARRKIMLDK